MQLLRASAVLVSLLAIVGCVHVEEKGREQLRLGPLRDLSIRPAAFDPVVTVDAGTDALTDEELSVIEHGLAADLEEVFSDLAADADARRIGTARVGACRLRAGAGQRTVLYVARCHVSLLVDGVTVAEATGECARKHQPLFLASRGQNVERDARLGADQSRAALVAALHAAAAVLMNGAVSMPVKSTTRLPREERAQLARDRMRTATTPAQKIVALFDLRSAGDPKDAALATPLLADDDPNVIVAALDAIGELCAPEQTAPVESVASEANEVLARARTRALSRLRTCASLARRP